MRTSTSPTACTSASTSSAVKTAGPPRCCCGRALRAELDAGAVTLYCGFDPTADSLHAGSLVPLLTLRRFQLAGHRPIALAGGATGLIGDPSGRSAERQLASVAEIAARVERLRAQMSRFLDFDGGAALLE